MECWNNEDDNERLWLLIVAQVCVQFEDWCVAAFSSYRDACTVDVSSSSASSAAAVTQ